MKRAIGFLLCLSICFLVLTGCRRYEPITDLAETADGQPESEESKEPGAGETAETDPQSVQDSSTTEESVISISNTPERTPVKVKGIYLTANTAGSSGRMDEIIGYLDQTELNAVVIDVKDDFGNVTFEMDSPAVNEIDAVKT